MLKCPPVNAAARLASFLYRLLPGHLFAASTEHNHREVHLASHDMAVSEHTKSEGNLDIVSWVLNNHTYDQHSPIYIDPDRPTRSLTATETRSLVKKLIAGLKAAGLKKGDVVCVNAFNDVRTATTRLGHFSCPTHPSTPSHRHDSSNGDFSLTFCRSTILLCYSPSLVLVAYTLVATHLTPVLRSPAISRAPDLASSSQRSPFSPRSLTMCLIPTSWSAMSSSSIIMGRTFCPAFRHGESFRTMAKPHG